MSRRQPKQDEDSKRRESVGMTASTEHDQRQVLVIGGAGYIGNTLVRRLLEDGYRVRVLDLLLYDHGAALSGLWEHPGFSFVHGDLRDAPTLERALEGVTDAVLLAAIVGDPAASAYPDLARSVNVDGAISVFDALDSHGVERFVFTSTCSNYGLRESDDLATEESELAPVSLYAENKVEFEQHALGRVSEVDVCPTILRIATAYGMSQRMRFDLTVSEFARTLAIGEDLLVYDADTWRPYCHVQDISSAIMTVFDSPKEAVRGEVFNVGHSDENYTKRMLADAALAALDGEGTVDFQEGGKDPRNYRVSFAKIEDRIGFKSQYRVPTSVASLVGAIRAGVFDDVEQRPTFYADHTLPERVG
jgi:nucleoside-diphosphate-sugar epimerase